LDRDGVAQGGDRVVERRDIDRREREVDRDAAGELDHVEVAVAEFVLDAGIGERGVAAWPFPACCTRSRRRTPAGPP
jgi:hypothetical protein